MPDHHVGIVQSLRFTIEQPTPEQVPIWVQPPVQPKDKDECGLDMRISEVTALKQFRLGNSSIERQDEVVTVPRTATQFSTYSAGASADATFCFDFLP